MPSSREIVLCRYRYDPLDRLTTAAPLSATELQRFYCKSRLATEIQGQIKHSIFQHNDQLLAQQRRSDDAIETALLATDQQRSVLHAFCASPPKPITYSPYGHRPADSGLLSLLGFNGERRDPVTGHYLLGNGYRAFNPVLMRFNSPDSLSPFGKGGLNSYAYCSGDPINWADKTGNMRTAMAISAVAKKARLEKIVGKIAKSSHAITKPTKQKTAGSIAAQSTSESVGTTSSVQPKNVITVLAEAKELEKNNNSAFKLAPLKRKNSDSIAESYNFHMNNSGEGGFHFIDGVPQVGTVYTIPSSQETFLYTGQFDSSFLYFENQIKKLSGQAQRDASTKLQATALNRADYIVRYIRG